MYYIAEHQIVEQWIIRIPFTCVLLEIIAICITRSILDFVMIIKYKRKQYDYYQGPILDNSYFADAPSYVEKYMESPIEKENATQKVITNAPVLEKINTKNKNAATDEKFLNIKAATGTMKNV